MSKTREQWLEQATRKLQRSVFGPADITLPEVRVSVGWPSKGGRAKKQTVIGQCWATKATKDDVAQLFISPTQDSGLRVLDVLAHELVHAVDDCENGHKGPFVDMIRRIGLEGKPTATTAGPELKATLERILEQLGEFPHAAIDPTQGERKQGTRMLKVQCYDSDYIVRMTQKWIDTVGLPLCPCHGEEMIQQF